MYLFSCHNADKSWLFRLLLVILVRNKKARLFFNVAAPYITQSMAFFDCFFIYVPGNFLQTPCIFLSFKGNIIWICAVRLVMSPSVKFISFCQKSSHRFLLFFFLVVEDSVFTEIIK